MQGRATGDQPATGQVELTAVIGAHQAACLFHQHHASGQIPGGEAAFPVAVAATSSHKGQIDRRCSAAAHAMGAMGEVGEFGVVVVQAAAAVVGKAGGEQGIGELAAATYPDRLVVAPGPQTRCRPVELVEHGNGQGPQQGLALPAEPHRGGEQRKAMGVVGGAIQGIDTPLQTALFFQPAALLGEHPDLRGLPLQQLQHRRFRRQVGLGDQIATTALLSHLLQLPEVPAQLLPSSQGGPAGHSSQFLQGFALET